MGDGRCCMAIVIAGLIAGAGLLAGSPWVATCPVINVSGSVVNMSPAGVVEKLP